MDLPLIFRLPHGLLFWLTFLWGYLPERRHTRAAARVEDGATPQDRGTWRLIVVGVWTSIAVSIVVALFAPFATIQTGRTLVFLAGVLLMASGSLLRRHCFRTLGSWFTYRVQTSADQPVIEQGAYRLIRHPSYTAGMMMFAGIGVALTNWISVFIMVAVPALIYVRRVRLEEEALSDTLGDRYRAYMGRTRRFVPYLF